MNICFLDCKDKTLIYDVRNKITCCNILEFDSIDEAGVSLGAVEILVVGRNPKISKEVLEKLVSCKIIIRNGIGFDNIDICTAREKDILVYNVSQYCTNDVAEHTFALLLNYTRNIKYHCQTHNFWGKSEMTNLRLNGKKLGVIGLGKIGKRVAEIAMAFGLKIYFYDPYVLKCKGCKKLSSLEELIYECDFITIHVPYNNETNNMINSDVLNNAQGIVIINTSRGKVVDSNAIVNCLKNGKVKAFLADVMETEPPDGNPLYERRNNGNSIYITPHVAFDSDESKNDLRNIICDIIETHNMESCVYHPLN